jgi:putative ABC transport system permease protein
MKVFYLYRLFYRELRKQKKKLALTVLALGWGTFSIVVLLAFGEGFQREMVRSFHGLGDGIAIVYGGQTSVPYRGMGKGRRIRLKPEDVDLLASRVKRIELISPENEWFSNTLTHAETDITARVIGVYPSFEELRTYYPDRGGRFINQKDMNQKRRVVFLGFNLKDKLFGDDPAIGRTIKINNMPFLVIGVMKEKMQNSMYNGPDSDKAAIPYSTYSSIYGERYIDRFIYRPRDLTEAASVKAEVYRVLAAKYKYDPSDTQALEIWDTLEEEKLTNNIFLGLQIFMAIIGGMTLLVAGVGVANIMYVSAKRRTKEIGIKMALGAKKRQVLLQFITESLLIVFIGGGWGAFFSFLAVEGARALPFEGEAGQLLGNPVISFEIMGLTALILSLIGFMAGLFPARRAAALNPVEALRYE